MIKKGLVVFGAVLMIGLFSGCGGTDQEDHTIDKESYDPEDIVETELGTLYLTYREKELDFKAESGPIELTVSGVQIGDLDEAEEHKGLFGKGKEVAIITITMESLNTSNEPISFYPNKAILTTETGDDIEADTFFSDMIGGAYEGEVDTKGDVVFIVDSKAKDIGQLNLQILGPKDEDDKSLGEQIELTIDLD